MQSVCPRYANNSCLSLADIIFAGVLRGFLVPTSFHNSWLLAGSHHHSTKHLFYQSSKFSQENISQTSPLSCFLLCSGHSDQTAQHGSAGVNGFVCGLVPLSVFVSPFGQGLQKCLVQLRESPCWGAEACPGQLPADRQHLTGTGSCWVSPL